MLDITETFLCTENRNFRERLEEVKRLEQYFAHKDADQQLAAWREGVHAVEVA